MSSSFPSSTTPAASAEDIAKHGWTAMPVDANAIFGKKPYLYEPASISVDDIPFPSDDPLVAKVQEYVRRELPEPTFNHSMRVYSFGKYIPLLPPFLLKRQLSYNCHLFYLLAIQNNAYMRILT